MNGKINVRIVVGIICACVIACAVCGCQNLMHKAVVIDSSVKAMKITMNDPNNPFPQVIVGFGRNCLVDMPMQEGSEVFYQCEESGIFTASLTGKTTIWMKAGKGPIYGHVQVEVADKKIIDLPIFKFFNPFTDAKEVTMKEEGK